MSTFKASYLNQLLQRRLAGLDAVRPHVLPLHQHPVPVEELQVGPSEHAQINQSTKKDNL